MALGEISPLTFSFSHIDLPGNTYILVIVAIFINWKTPELFLLVSERHHHPELAWSAMPFCEILLDHYGLRANRKRDLKI